MFDPSGPGSDILLQVSAKYPHSSSWFSSPSTCSSSSSAPSGAPVISSPDTGLIDVACWLRLACLPGCIRPGMPGRSLSQPGLACKSLLPKNARRPEPSPIVYRNTWLARRPRNRRGIALPMVVSSPTTTTITAGPAPLRESSRRTVARTRVWWNMDRTLHFCSHLDNFSRLFQDLSGGL